MEFIYGNWFSGIFELFKDYSIAKPKYTSNHTFKEVIFLQERYQDPEKLE